MVDIIRLHGDPHQQTQTLLCWYANGTLEADEVAYVEAHLSECPACRAELESERALSSEIAHLPPEVDHVWSALRATVEAPSRRRAAARRLAPADFLRRPISLGWALAAQAASLAVVGALLWMAAAPTQPAYRTLSSPPTASAGNVVVIFKPTTSEQELREALRQSSARLVDGPTASDAYILHVAPREREAALSRLRGDTQVVLAEPIDGILQP